MTHEHPLHLHRRDALKWMAASMALATGACTRLPDAKIHPWVDMPEARGDDSPLFYATAVLRDGYAQGVLVTTHGGRPTKVEGNPLHPSSLGATSVFAQAAVLDLWDPDRSQAPTQRLGRGAKGPPAISTWAAFETEWRERATAIASNGGAGVRLLSGPVTSPTLRAQIDALLKRWPAARWHQYGTAPGSLAGDAQPVYRFDRATCIVSLGGDPFSDGPGAVRYAMDWSQRRASSGPARAFAVETSPGLFGARADERIALPPREIDAMAARLLAGKASNDFERRVLDALNAAGRDALVTGSPASRVLNEKLGATGNTVTYLAPFAHSDSAGTIGELARDLDTGRVQVLLILDANPAYDAPGELKFAQALAHARLSIHCGPQRDETARLCEWHLPVSHTFEQWSDALAHDGTPAIIQPAIAPLYDTRSLHEILALVMGDDVRDGHAIVQTTWRSRMKGDFDASWRDALRTGIVKNPVMPDSIRHAVSFVGDEKHWIAGQARNDKGLEAVFVADASTHDGRFANNAWLQELPRPFTKHTWDNAAFIGPQTARAAGVGTGDIVRIRAEYASVEAPVWVQPTHCEGAITLPLGYGRTSAGRVGNGIGFNAFHLMPATQVEIERTGRKHDFAVTQHTLDPSGREPARSVAAGGRVEPEPEHPSLYDRWTYPEHAWAMTIDLDACIGCNACTIACQAENNIPVVGKDQVSHGRAMHWIRVDNYEAPELHNTIFQPVPCMHCENAPCELVCPVGATMHDSEGLNVQVYNRCIGTRFCSNNCPYKVRRFNFLQFTDTETESLKGQRNPNVTVRNRGVMEKCNYCLQRVARARQHSQRTGEPLVDGDVVTACQAACPTKAIHFGDLTDAKSDVVSLRNSPRHYSLLGELNTRPRTTYLARLRSATDPVKGEKT